jgi:hypothetical protein
VRQIRGMMERKTFRYLIRRLITLSSLITAQFVFEFLTNAAQVDCSLVLDGEMYKLLCPFLHKRRRRCADERRQSKREKISDATPYPTAEPSPYILQNIYIDDSHHMPIAKVPWITVPRVMVRIIAGVQPVNIIHIQSYISSSTFLV